MVHHRHYNHKPRCLHCLQLCSKNLRRLVRIFREGIERMQLELLQTDQLAHDSKLRFDYVTCSLWRAIHRDLEAMESMITGMKSSPYQSNLWSQVFMTKRHIINQINQLALLHNYPTSQTLV